MQSIRHYIKSAARVGASVALAAVMAVGAGLATADAQTVRAYGQDWIITDRNMRRADIRQVATVNGYAEGYEAGLRDRRSRRAFNYRNDTAYRTATEGWERGWGRQNDYRTYFRQGFVQGYSDGYYSRQRNRNYDRARVWNDRRIFDNRGGYDPYYNYPSYGSGNVQGYYSNSRGDLNPQEVAQRASQNGYYAGYQRGLYDAQIGASRPNPTGHGAYQFALDGFDPEWGSASTYQRYYRQYFVQGYNDAFQRRAFNQRYNRRF